MADRGGDQWKIIRCKRFEGTACVCPTFMFVFALSYVMMMPFKRQALVEFSAVESADRCVSCGAKEPVYIAGLIARLFTVKTFWWDWIVAHACMYVCMCSCVVSVCPSGQQAYFNYSTSKRITRPTNADNPNSGNKVLLLSIQNPLYPITTVNTQTLVFL